MNTTVRTKAVLTEDQAEQLEQIQGAYPDWRIWWSHGIWYATGVCADCGEPRTLHGPTDAGLIGQLAVSEQRVPPRLEA